MGIKGIDLTIYTGKKKTRKLSRDIMEAMGNIKVTRTMEGPSTFSIIFYAHRDRAARKDYNVLSGPQLQVYNRLKIEVSFNGKFYTVIDGFITDQHLGYDESEGTSTLTVTGEDVSAAMADEEYTREFNQVGDARLVRMVLGKYRSLGIHPQIVRTKSTRVPISKERFPQQNSTDRCFVRKLAGHHGFIFFVKPGKRGRNTAYWGPPVRNGPFQKTLTVDMGPESNVEEINYSYNAQAPMVYFGMVQDDISEKIKKLRPVKAKLKHPLAAKSAQSVNKKFLRKKIFTVHRLGLDRSRILAQGAANRSTGKAVSVEGRVDTLFYGDIIDVPGRVDLRGAGYTNSGTYIVSRVSHLINRLEYKQEFTLSREGTGRTKNKVKT